MTPDLFALINRGREIEVEAVEGGRASNEFSTSPFPESGEDEMNDNWRDDEPVNFSQVDDIVDTEERRGMLEAFVTYANKAYSDRGMKYPFVRSKAGDRLEIKPGMNATANKCAALSQIISQGGANAKLFERRAASALHVFLGGWHANVGSPWEDKKTVTKVAVESFRKQLGSKDCGDQWHSGTESNIRGDFGVDGIAILGRRWGGPILIMQSKNAPFNTEKFAADLIRGGDAMFAWFGRRVDHFRSVLNVCAVNTILTIEDKELEFQGAGPGRGYHIIDAIDIVFAESVATGGSEILENDFICI